MLAFSQHLKVMAVLNISLSFWAFEVFQSFNYLFLALCPTLVMDWDDLNNSETWKPYIVSVKTCQNPYCDTSDVTIACLGPFSLNELNSKIK